ncbi:MAG: hypothetical protein JXR10_10320 [Cyclobacteriaceae bacterium]
MRTILSLFLLLPILAPAQDSAEDVQKKAVTYHDSNDLWPNLQATFNFIETRPSGPDRKTVIEFNNPSSYMKINRNDEEIFEVTSDTAVVIKGDAEQERGVMLRNYYLYLWGLPMKLMDESTPTLTLAKDQKVNDVNCKVVRVAYQKDTWYFSFDSNTGRMLQYSFYQDEAETKGELILLEDEIEYQGLKIPQKRSWYTLPDKKFLGTDVLTSIE